MMMMFGGKSVVFHDLTRRFDPEEISFWGISKGKNNRRAQMKSQMFFLPKRISCSSRTPLLLRETGNCRPSCFLQRELDLQLTFTNITHFNELLDLRMTGSWK